MKKTYWLLVPLVAMACNLSQAAPANRDYSESFGGQRENEPLPTLLPAFDLDVLDSPDGSGEPVEGIVVLSEGFLPDLASDQLPAEFGGSRTLPYQTHTRLITKSWTIQVLEVLRGEQAWERILQDKPKAPPAPQGYEYLIARLYLYNKSTSQYSKNIGITDIAVVGDDGVLRTDGLNGFPRLDLFYKDIYSGESLVGWLDALVAIDERNPLLAIQLEFVVDDKEAEGRLVHYIALAPGAAYIPSADSTPIPTNNLGRTPEQPTPLGQTAITDNWELTVLEVLRGEQMMTLLKTANINNREPPEGQAYLAARLRLHYRPVGEKLVFATTRNFTAQGTLGTRTNDVMFLIVPEQRHNWLYSGLYPGATAQGWVMVQVEQDEQQALLVFIPPNNLGIELFMSLD